MAQSTADRKNTTDNPNPAIKYLIALIVLAVILAFIYIFTTEIWYSWNPPPPDWILDLHDPISALASLVGGVVAVSFAVKPSSKQKPLGSPHLANFLSLGQIIAPPGNEKLKIALGAIFAGAYVCLGLVAIGTWAYVGSTNTSADVKSLATNFGGMISPIVLAFFSGTQTAVG